MNIPMGCSSFLLRKLANNTRFIGIIVFYFKFVEHERYNFAPDIQINNEHRFQPLHKKQQCVIT